MMGRIVQVTTAIATLFEFILAIALLAVFASAYPDRYRTALWREGGSKGYNSDPSYRTYLWANYEEMPPMPLIWDESSTQYNLCIAVITTVLWFVRLCIRGRTLDICGSIVSNALYDMILVAFWSYSGAIQASGDISDPKQISLRPWYLDHKCSEALPSNRTACQAAQCSFGLTIFAVLWFCVRCLTICMYGAYVYGQSADPAHNMHFDTEKGSSLLPEDYK